MKPPHLYSKPPYYICKDIFCYKKFLLPNTVLFNLQRTLLVSEFSKVTSPLIQIVYEFKYISWYCSTLQYICITTQKHHKTQL